MIKLVSSHIEIDGYSNIDNCLKEKIKINNVELFNRLIKIDYENNKVSFNYLDENEEYYKNTNNIIRSHLYADYNKNNRYYNYSHYIYRNYKDNIIKNPLYNIIKDQLEIDYSYTEPNLKNKYNNKSKYFSRSLNDFIETYNLYKEGFLDDNYKLDKYYETYYLYLKSIDDNNYFIEKVFIDFPLIEIYDEYDYIQKIISSIADIYNLPIIPPIKFI